MDDADDQSRCTGSRNNNSHTINDDATIIRCLSQDRQEQLHPTRLLSLGNELEHDHDDNNPQIGNELEHLHYDNNPQIFPSDCDECDRHNNIRCANHVLTTYSRATCTRNATRRQSRISTAATSIRYPLTVEQLRLFSSDVIGGLEDVTLEDVTTYLTKYQCKGGDNSAN
mmetsp:Transcript_10812/g.12532  ORF Transcript_10812/g.12532 Transcript_10812/m.12532 type:complete len:170 (-) Transcript_10812:236-745(-)